MGESQRVGPNPAQCPDEDLTGIDGGANSPRKSGSEETVMTGSF